MHENNFEILSRHKILAIHSVVFKEKIIKTVLTTKQFNRITTKPYWFSYSDYLQTIEQMYIGD